MGENGGYRGDKEVAVVMAGEVMEEGTGADLFGGEGGGHWPMLKFSSE